MISSSVEHFLRMGSPASRRLDSQPTNWLCIRGGGHWVSTTQTGAVARRRIGGWESLAWRSDRPPAHLRCGLSGCRITAGVARAD